MFILNFLSFKIQHTLKDKLYNCRIVCDLFLFLEPISLQQKLLGCFRISENLIKPSEEKWTMSQQPTTISCFVYCENKGQVVSGYRSYDEQCFCGEFTSK